MAPLHGNQGNEPAPAVPSGSVGVRITVAADHAGHPLKQTVVDNLRGAGYEVTDLGTNDPTTPTDYPDVAEQVCARVLSAQAERGVLLCGSGIGMSVAANKFPGIRAGVCHDTYSAHQAVEHVDMNVLCLGARVVGAELAGRIVRAFAAAKYTGEERHGRRLRKIIDLEKRFVSP